MYLFWRVGSVLVIMITKSLKHVDHFVHKLFKRFIRVQADLLNDSIHRHGDLIVRLIVERPGILWRSKFTEGGFEQLVIGSLKGTTQNRQVISATLRLHFRWINFDGFKSGLNTPFSTTFGHMYSCCSALSSMPTHFWWYHVWQTSQLIQFCLISSSHLPHRQLDLAELCFCLHGSHV